MAKVPKNPPPTIYVVGGGSIGAFLAGRHAAAGMNTVLIVRTPERRDALQGGLEFLPAFGEIGGFRAKPTVATWADCPPFPANTRIFLCCKVFQFEEALFEIRARLQDDSELVFCQNGLGVFEEAEQFLFPTPRWQRAICWFGVRPRGQGKEEEFLVSGQPGIELGGSRPDLLVQTAEDLRQAGIPVLFEGPAAQAEWRKALWNLGCNAICALVGAPNGEIASNPHLRSVAEATMLESMQVGQALGVFLGPEDKERAYQAAEAGPSNLNSMLQDLRHGRPTELPWLNGYIVREGKRLGIDTPVNRTVTALVTFMSERNQKTS